MPKQHLQNINLVELNKRFKPLSATQRIVEFYKLFHSKEVLVTSSFGTTSVMLLHLISKVNSEQAIHFVDTTFHFNETIKYKEDLINQLSLDVVNILPDKTHNELTRKDKSWENEAGLCCMVNKVITLDAVKVNFKYWITGMMAYQTHFRSGLDIFEISGNHLKFHPLIDVTNNMWSNYVKNNNLPKHPLLKQGYGSVGCTHCTVKGKGRTGRWAGSTKTECGLHNDIIKESNKAEVNRLNN